MWILTFVLAMLEELCATNHYMYLGRLVIDLFLLLSVLVLRCNLWPWRGPM